MTIQFTHATTEPWTRNHNGWPMITPADGGKPIPYMRASKIAKYLGDTFQLEQWMKRQVVLGMAARDDLVLLAKASTPEDKQRLNDIAKQASDAARSNQAANVGTAIHTFTDRVDDGMDPNEVPEPYRADLIAYKAALEAAGLEVVAKELSVANDHIQVAGTFDRLFRMTKGQRAGQVAVGDLKTGGDDRFPHAACQQIATYANAHLYREDKGGRYGYLPDLGVSTEIGLMVHLPQGTGTCAIYELDIIKGWALVLTAIAVKRSLADKTVIKPYTP
jgi:hypothetical protein